MFDIQSALYGSSSVVIPDGFYDVDSTIQVPRNVGFGGAMPGGVVINVVTPGIAAFTPLNSDENFTGNHACNLTIQTEQPNVCGFYSAKGGDNTYRDIKFRGTARNVHVNGGKMHTLSGLRSYSSPLGTQQAGVLLFESSDEIGYAQYISIDDYHSWGQTSSTPLILHRATNVVATRLFLHEPGMSGILIDDDSQGVQISNSHIVKPLHGVVVQAANGKSPLGVSLTNVDVDQCMDGGFGYFLTGGKDIRVIGNYLTDSWQGIYLGAYPGLERVTVALNHLAGNHANAIFAAAGAGHFRIYDNDVTGHIHGGAIYVGPGAHDFRVMNNDMVENNMLNFVDQSGSVSKTVAPNWP